jgi:beta-glucosidase
VDRRLKNDRLSYTRDVRSLFVLLLAAVKLQAAGTLTVVSAATYIAGTLAPESLATIFGTDLGPQIVVTDSTGTARTAPVVYNSTGQIDFEIPAATAFGTATVTDTAPGGNVSQGTLNIGPISPAIFPSGAGIVVTNPDSTQTGGAIPETCIPRSSQANCYFPLTLGPSGSQTVLELFGTGIRGRSSLANVTCLIGGNVNAPVLYAGPAPGFIGLDQVNIVLAPYLSGPILDVVLTVDGQPANTVRIAPLGPTATDRATQIVGQMTLDEKIASLHGIQDNSDYRTVPGVARLGIPALNITNGPAGATNGGPGHQGSATALPAPISLAATWDNQLANLYGTVVGKEAKALANGFLEGPDINIARVPQNGRTFEAFGEDPYLVGQMAANEIAGIQSQGIIAEAKHYAGNNQEANRLTINDIIDERTLHEIYLPAFQASVQQGRAGAVMCAYNQVNGAYACENNLLMNQILKTDWAFQGFITSDFGAVHSTVPSALAGLDLEMPTGIYFTDPLSSAVQSGQVPMSVIDDKLIRRLSTMIRFGIFDNPPVNTPVATQADGVIARRIAEAGMVLLKNDGAVLPLNASQLHSVALIGPYASAPKTGGGGSSQVVPAYTVTPLAGIQSRVGSSVTVSLSTGSNINQAVSLAQAADVAIVMVGDDEAEGTDHPISLSGNQDQLVQAIAAANPHTVVVVKSGSAVLMPWVASVPAVLEAWYPGEEDGNAVAAVLFGDVNPSGKLPLTFPVNVSDLPANTPAQYPGVNGVANYSEGVFVGYRYFDANNIAPLFPFGHGLSYTTFSYANLAPIAAINPTNGLVSSSVDFDVTNTGSVAGAEVAQVYVGLSSAPVPEPPIQLKGFQKVTLQPGQTAHVSIPFDQSSVSYWDVNSHGWLAAPGPYNIMVGSSSRDIRLSSGEATSSTPQPRPQR